MAALPLGTAASFAVLAGSTVTNTGSSAIVGNLGVSPGTAVTGFPPGVVTGGTIHNGDAVALLAETDLTTAYNVLAGEAAQADLTGQDLGGKTLTAGVYHFSSSAQLTGTLTLDAQGDPNARFDFQIGSTLTTASASTIRLINGADACNVNWQIGSSATLGTDTSFEGNLLALTSITLNTRANIVSGRALARNGAVTLDTNSVSNVCVMDTTTPGGGTPGTTTPGTGPGTTTPGGGTPGTNTPGVNTPGTNTPGVNLPGLNPPTVDGGPPVLILRRFGFHAQETTLVLSFNTPLDPTRAQDIGNYRIVTLGGPGRGGSRVGHSIRVLSAAYDASAHTVTLRTAERLDVHNTYRLTVNGSAPAGLSYPTGAPLGRNFVETISRSSLAGPSPSFIQANLLRKAEHSSVVARISARGVDALLAAERGTASIHLARRRPH